jgi:hypothetical protein
MINLYFLRQLGHLFAEKIRRFPPPPYGGFGFFGNLLSIFILKRDGIDIQAGSLQAHKSPLWSQKQQATSFFYALHRPFFRLLDLRQFHIHPGQPVHTIT